jgi:hypothetical protein
VANAATLSISVEAQVGNASRALKQVKNDLGSVSDAVTKVELSQRDAKQAIGTLTASLGAQGGVVAEVAKNLLEMGPALGVAVGAVAVLNHVMAENQKQAQANAEIVKTFSDRMKTLGELTGAVEAPGAFSQAAATLSDQLLKDMEKLNAELKEAEKNWAANGARITELTGQIEVMAKARRDALQIKNVMSVADSAEKLFKDKHFDLMMNTLPDSEARRGGELALLREKAGHLKNVRDAGPQSGAAFDMADNAWKDAMLAAQAVADQMKAKQDEAAKKALEDERKRAEEVQRHEDELWKQKGEEMIRFHEEEDRMNAQREKAELKAAEAKAKYEADLNRRVEEEMAKMDNKNPTGFAQAFDTSLINVSSFANAGGKVQQVSDPTVAGYLRQMLERQDREKAAIGVTTD